MGLDMYLTKKYYVKNWNHMKEEEKHHITIKKGDKISEIPTDKISEIIVDVLYWRKENAIHNWFVVNVQKGEDDCKEYYVSEEKLQELLNIVKEVLQNHGKAEGLLPTLSGFFFGGIEYDQYYWEGLEDTRKGLEKELVDKSDGEFYYKSSW